MPMLTMKWEFNSALLGNALWVSKNQEGYIDYLL